METTETVCVYQIGNLSENSGDSIYNNKWPDSLFFLSSAFRDAFSCVCYHI